MSSPDRYLYTTTPLNRWGDAPTPPSSSSDPLYEKCTELLSLLPALLVVVVILGAVASGWPLRAAVLLGLLQEFIQTEGILLKLNRSFAPLPVVGAWELFVWGKPESGQENNSSQIHWQGPEHFEWEENNPENIMEQMSLVNVRQSKTVFNILFCTMVSHPVANQTFLKDNDNLVTKHMGQAMLD